MDDRGYVAQALFDRLSEEGTRFRVLGDTSGYPERAPPLVQLAVAREALSAMPRAIARFCHELDLQLVQLHPEDARAWRAMLAWSDEVGRPRFLGVRICSDFCRGPRCYLRAEELLAGAPDAQFAHALVDAVESAELPAERAAWLCALWTRDSRGAIERVARFWRSSQNIRLLAQAAKHGEWSAVRASLPALRRALRRAVLPEPADAIAWLAAALRNLVQPARAAVLFMGRESVVRTEVMGHVARDLAPLGLTLHEAGTRGPRPGLRVVFDAHQDHPDVVGVRSDRGLAQAVVAAERAILRWLECRVEHRYPEALVGENPFAARLLQFAVRNKLPLVQFFMGCSIRARLGSPVLMPYPFGIVIEAGTRIGSRVTVMHQVSLLGGPTIEDNVSIGPGAKVIGAVRIGRGASIGANAVVTEDVPSHDKVVVEKRRPERRSVVNV
ncbi:MAG TPA: serine acetyltransferase [Burkholderiales bacterium]